MPASTISVTVVTPTYNRGPLLGRVYASLRAQTCQDFEWLVVDDGSTDDTPGLISDWQQAAGMSIRYLRQDNGGKHVALNRAFNDARGSFCAVLDSDDWYVPQTLERLLFHWNAIDAGVRDRFASVEGLCSYPDGSPVGTRFPSDVFDSDSLDVRYVHKVEGDTMGMFRTDVLRLFPFPEHLGRFIPEALVWWRIGARYQSRFVNEVLGRKEYLPGGLSDSGVAEAVTASPAYAMLFSELATTSHPLARRRRMRARAQYVRYAFHAGVAPARQMRVVAPHWWVLAAPFGVALYLRDLRSLA